MKERTFIVVDYKDLHCRVDDKVYEVTLDDNMWYVSGEVAVIYTGTLSPIGSSDIVPEGEYCSVSFGDRFLIKDGQTYTLYGDSYYAEWYKGKTGE